MRIRTATPGDFDAVDALFRRIEVPLDAGISFPALEMLRDLPSQ